MEPIDARSIFSPATGFIRRGGFDWTCNPYLGCTFGCTYCYAMFTPQNRRPRSDWGRWVAAKRNAVELAERKAAKLAGQSLYLSSVTDPYQPAERSLLLTRGILEALAPHGVRLLVQTRGPLVVRDLDVLADFASVRVNFSIPTDSEAVWRAFEPKSPPLERRWQAARSVRDAGIPVGLCLTPLLPLDDAESFIARTIDFEPDVLVLQDFHDSRGGFGADTGAVARRLLERRGWTADDYRRVLERFRERMDKVYEGEEGFFPPAQSRMPMVTRSAIQPSSLR